MPSHSHEILIEMFRYRPALAAELLGGPLHIAIPDFTEARLSPGDLTDVAPTEYRADAVVTLGSEGVTALAVVIEVQLRIDPRMRRTWPAYVATLHERLGCPVVLLVVCPDRAVADWCATPIVIGPGFVPTPAVLGPSQVPVMTDLDAARRVPELAVWSAISHGAEPDPKPILEALPTALDVIEHDFARRRFDAGVARGEARGAAKALLAALGFRGIAVPEKTRAEIHSCTDLAQLYTWIRRAATAHKIQDLHDQIAQ